MIKRLLTMTLIISLGGCTLMPEYTRPQAPVPTAWPSGPAYKETSKTAPAATDLHWRQFFNDPRLQQIIQIALNNNRDLRIATLNVEKTRGMYGIQRGELYPRVETGISASQQHVLITGGTGLVTIKQYNVNLGVSSWEVDLFGRIRSLSKEALEQYFASKEGRRAVQISLLAETANAYLALAADQENLRLAQSTLKTQQDAYHLIQRRFEVGIVPELDLRQAQTRVDSARVDVAKYTQLVAQDHNALNLLAGSPVPVDLLPQELSAIKPLPEVSAGTSSEVLLRRPDILQAEDLLKAANADIGAARAAFFPQITLTSAIGSASGQLDGLFQPGSLAWNYAPNLVLPVFDARTWSALKVSNAQKKIAVAQYEKAIQSAFREVADALAQRGTLGDQMMAQQSLVDATAKTYKLSNARYQKGIDIYLNVLDAQRSLYSAEQGLIAIRLAKLASQVQLYTVLGGGGDAGALPKGG
jgi:outer membrane protein, multidrug efflux system